MVRVLVVEDEEFLADAVQSGLQLAGFSVDRVGDGAAALEAVAVHAYDVVVLDRDLPLVHGDEVCRAVVAMPEPPRVLMLTAATTIDDRVAGLSIGADDYLGKPFDLAELTARVTALHRRPSTVVPPILRLAGLTLDPFHREVFRDERVLHLSRKEFAVLEVLLRAGGGVVSAEQLLEKAWDENADPFTNAVRVTVSTLRKKVGADRIETVPGVGYRIARRSA
jgi:two-component system response regulator VanR